MTSRSMARPFHSVATDQDDIWSRPRISFFDSKPVSPLADPDRAPGLFGGERFEGFQLAVENPRVGVRRVVPARCRSAIRDRAVSGETSKLRRTKGTFASAATCRIRSRSFCRRYVASTIVGNPALRTSPAVAGEEILVKPSADLRSVRVPVEPRLSGLAPRPEQSLPFDVGPDPHRTQVLAQALRHERLPRPRNAVGHDQASRPGATVSFARARYRRTSSWCDARSSGDCSPCESRDAATLARTRAR